MVQTLFELQVGERSSDYDPTAARSRGKGGSVFKGAAGISSSQAPSARSNTAPASTEPRRHGSAANSKENRSAGVNKAGDTSSRAAGSKVSSLTASAAEVVALKRQASDMKLEMDGLERERDFYFNKLRDIEIMLQDIEESGQGTELTSAIFKILYATAEGLCTVSQRSKRSKPAYELTF